MKFLRNKKRLDQLLQQSLNYVKHNHVQSNFQHGLLLTVSRRLAVQARNIYQLNIQIDLEAH